MRKFYIFALVATMFAACATDGVNEPSAVIGDLAPETLTVSFEGEESRIQLQEGKTVWNEGDLVSVFYRSNANQKWQFQGATGDRTGNLKRVEMGTATETMNRVVVVYPYAENYYINPETYNVEASLPATQTYIADSYGIGGNIMVSYGEYNQVVLKSVCGWLKLELTGNGESIKSITLKGNNGEQVAGQLYINSADATATLASEMGGAEDNGSAGGNLVFEDTIFKEVTLNCGDGVVLGAEPTAFYIALPPQTFAKGISLEITAADDSKMTKSTDKEVVIERNHILPMEAFGFDGVREQPNNEIWYTATAKVTPYKTDVLGANIVSNEWDSTTGEGVITFDGDVIEIGKSAFYNITSLTSLTIPNSVASIVPQSIYRCSKLKAFYSTFATEDNRCLVVNGVLTSFAPNGIAEYSIPNSVTSIGNHTFAYCSELTSVTIPDSVTSIGNYAFTQCTKLSNVVIGNGISSLATDNNIFSDCSLESVTIPSSITFIGRNTFYGNSIKKVNVVDLSTWYNIEFENEYSNPLRNGGQLYIDGNAITELIIPSGVTEIKPYAFYCCSGISSISIPDSVTTIGYGAFSLLSNSLSIYISDLSAYCNINLTSATTTVEHKLYLNGNEVTELTIPSDVTIIKPYKFYGCSSLTSVTIHNSVTSIEKQAFYNSNNLTELTIGNNVTTIGEQAFYSCDNIENLTIPQNVQEISNSAFRNCASLTNVTIGNGVKKIGNYAFGGCSNLSKVIIGSNVSSIGDSTFLDCNNLVVHCKPTTPPSIQMFTFSYTDKYDDVQVSKTTKIYVPASSVSAYKTAQYWSHRDLTNNIFSETEMP